jgi:hypothetical protein
MQHESDSIKTAYSKGLSNSLQICISPKFSSHDWVPCWIGGDSFSFQHEQDSGVRAKSTAVKSHVELVATVPATLRQGCAPFRPEIVIWEKQSR